MFELLSKFLNVLDENWKDKIIGATSDGAANMTGKNEGTVFYIQKVVKPGFFQFWCGLHQLDVVVQKLLMLHYDKICILLSLD